MVDKMFSVLRFIALFSIVNNHVVCHEIPRGEFDLTPISFFNKLQAVANTLTELQDILRSQRDELVGQKEEINAIKNILEFRNSELSKQSIELNRQTVELNRQTVQLNRQTIESRELQNDVKYIRRTVDDTGNVLNTVRQSMAKSEHACDISTEIQKRHYTELIANYRNDMLNTSYTMIQNRLKISENHGSEFRNSSKILQGQIREIAKLGRYHQNHTLRLRDELSDMKSNMRNSQNELSHQRTAIVNLTEMVKHNCEQFDDVSDMMRQGLSNFSEGFIEQQKKTKVNTDSRMVNKSLQLMITLATNMHMIKAQLHAFDCHDFFLLGFNQSGVYNTIHGKPVYCDMDEGGWLVFQRRLDGSVDFFRTWAEYRQGFGDLEGEFWLGLDRIHQLTYNKRYMLRIVLEEFDGNTAYADYSYFSVSGESQKYKLSLGEYTGNATDSFSNHKKYSFTTKDQDNDIWPSNCAAKFKGGWWYNNCYLSNLNGMYHAGQHSSYADGVNWQSWKGYHYSLKSTIMKIKPGI